MKLRCRNDSWSKCDGGRHDGYDINGQTNLFVKTCERLSRKEPECLLDGPELFWFRNEPELNRHLVPLLEKLYLDPGLASRQREEAFDDLASRTNDL